MEEADASLKIFVKTPNGESVSMEIKRSATIKDLKLEVCEKKSLSPSIHGLFLGDEQLVNDCIIGDYNIKDGSILQLAALCKIFIRTEKQLIITHYCITSTTVGQVKRDLSLTDRPYCSELNRYKFDLIFADKVLDDDSTLSCCNIQPKSTLYVRESEMTITIKSGRRKFTISATPSMTVLSLNRKIQDRKHVQALPYDNIGQYQFNDQMLRFKGTCLCNRFTLAYYSVQNLSTIFLERRVCINVRSSCRAYGLKVFLSNTVRSLKGQFKICLGWQRLYFAGQLLHDDRTLKSYKIQSGSTIDLCFENVHITSTSGRTITITGVDEKTTVEDVKTTISKLNGIPEKQIKFVKDDCVLDLDNDCEVLSVNPGPKLSFQYLVDSLEMLVFIEIPTNHQLITLIVSRSSTIEGIRSILADQTQIDKRVTIPSGFLLLVDNKKWLRDNLTLSDFSPLGMHLSLKILAPVFITLPNDNVRTVNISPVTTVKEVKSWLYSFPCLLKVHLIYGNEKLDDDHYLSLYGVKADSILHVRESEMTINVSSRTASNFTVNVRPSTTIIEVKSMIHYEKGIPPSDQKLFPFCPGWMELQDTSTISNSIVGDCVLFSLVVPVVVSVQTRSENVLRLRASTINELKMKIQEQISVPEERQNLLYDGQIIGNNYFFGAFTTENYAISC